MITNLSISKNPTFTELEFSKVEKTIEHKRIDSSLECWPNATLKIKYLRPSMTNMAKPFLKWAGGKRQLLDEIMEKLPSDVSNCTTYIEPFVGAGAVLFHLLESEEEEFGKLEKFHIIDINAELILCYKALKHDSKCSSNWTS